MSLMISFLVTNLEQSSLWVREGNLIRKDDTFEVYRYENYFFGMNPFEGIK